MSRLTKAEYSAQLQLLQDPEALHRERKRLNRGQSKLDADLEAFFRELDNNGYTSSSSLHSSAAPSRRNSFSPRKVDKGPTGQINAFEELKAHTEETQRYGRQFQDYLNRRAAPRRASVAQNEVRDAAQWTQQPQQQQAIRTTVTPRDIMPYDYNAYEWQPSIIQTPGFTAVNNIRPQAVTYHAPRGHNSPKREQSVPPALKTTTALAGRVTKPQRAKRQKLPKANVGPKWRWKCTFPSCTSKSFSQSYNVYIHSRNLHAGLRTEEEHMTAKQVHELYRL